MDYARPGNDVKMLHYIFKPFYASGRLKLEQLFRDNGYDAFGIFDAYLAKATAAVA